MKKLVFLLLVAAIGNALSAQVTPLITPLSSNSTPASELTFNWPAVGTTNNRFFFILPNNNRMIIEVRSLPILQQLPNLDSLFDKVWEGLRPVYDSLSDPLMIRRVDYVSSANDTKIRIKQYAPTGTFYSYKDDELVQMKVDQDTLRYRGYIESGNSTINYYNNFYAVTLVLNNISDVTRLPEGLLQSGLELLLPDLKDALAKSAKSTSAHFYYAVYDMRTRKRVAPRNENNMGYGKKTSFAPFAQVGVQYVRGAFVPSAGAGIEYSVNESNQSKQAIRLIWEPYFYFIRDDKDKVMLQRNDFVTLKFYTGYNSAGPGRTFAWNQNFSVGALVYRKGELFEKGTFKLELPGLQAKNLVLTPEFFFNKIFRNFSPSMKLTVNLD